MKNMQICRDIIFIRIAPSYKCWYFCWFLVVLPEVSDSPGQMFTNWIRLKFLQNSFDLKICNLIDSKGRKSKNSIRINSKCIWFDLTPPQEPSSDFVENEAVCQLYKSIQCLLRPGFYSLPPSSQGGLTIPHFEHDLLSFCGSNLSFFS